MSDQAVLKISIEFNSVVYENFNAFTEDEREISRQINLMNTTIHARMVPRNSFSITKVRVIGDSIIDFENFINGTVTIEYEGGERVTFQGVHTMVIGAETTNGEGELESELTFGASNRIQN